ncbi:hypothetical protein [Tautonia plasticadhaerens]|uniref:Uncharacterized protein n=1 Tax=Tautonia plasticadhaerens TaxID=2527974 RepID=A0A518H9A2_9BACT|nr:hypothetical protein [Tautonia plasticadhaerens]QDV37438.1 hypothetical protein ElP_53770 [Tautonia plasticadhaerens]
MIFPEISALREAAARLGMSPGDAERRLAEVRRWNALVIGFHQNRAHRLARHLFLLGGPSPADLIDQQLEQLRSRILLLGGPAVAATATGLLEAGRRLQDATQTAWFAESSAGARLRCRDRQNGLVPDADSETMYQELIVLSIGFLGELDANVSRAVGIFGTLEHFRALGSLLDQGLRPRIAPDSVTIDCDPLQPCAVPATQRWLGDVIALCEARLPWIGLPTVILDLEACPDRLGRGQPSRVIRTILTTVAVELLRDGVVRSEQASQPAGEGGRDAMGSLADTSQEIAVVPPPENIGGEGEAARGSPDEVISRPPIPGPATPGKAREKRRRLSQEETEQRVGPYLEAQIGRGNWPSIRQVTRATGTAQGTVHKTAAWRTYTAEKQEVQRLLPRTNPEVPTVRITREMNEALRTDAPGPATLCELDDELDHHLRRTSGREASGHLGLPLEERIEMKKQLLIRELESKYLEENPSLEPEYRSMSREVQFEYLLVYQDHKRDFDESNLEEGRRTRGHRRGRVDPEK